LQVSSLLLCCFRSKALSPDTSASLQDHAIASKRDEEVQAQKYCSNIEIIKVRQQCYSIDEAMKWSRM